MVRGEVEKIIPTGSGLAWRKFVAFHQSRDLAGQQGGFKDKHLVDVAFEKPTRTARRCTEVATHRQGPGVGRGGVRVDPAVAPPGKGLEAAVHVDAHMGGNVGFGTTEVNDG